MSILISQNSQEKTCVRASLFFNKVIKKEALAQVFSCEFCEIFKSTFFTEHLWTTASGINFCCSHENGDKAYKS